MTNKENSLDRTPENAIHIQEPKFESKDQIIIWRVVRLLIFILLTVFVYYILYKFDSLDECAKSHFELFCNPNEKTSRHIAITILILALNIAFVVGLAGIFFTLLDLWKPDVAEKILAM